MIADRSASIVSAFVVGELRQSAIVQAEGFALALTQIQASASGLDPNTMTLQYFDALKKLGASPATGSSSR